MKALLSSKQASENAKKWQVYFLKAMNLFNKGNKVQLFTEEAKKYEIVNF